MTITGDLFELIDDDSSHVEKKVFDNIPWELDEDTKIPPETLALYSIDSGIILINELKNAVFDGIESSSFSHICVNFSKYDEIFVLFFEFAIEKYGEFEFVHFGIVPTSDFFNVLDDNPIIKIRTKRFQFTKSAVEKILERLTEFKTKYPNNALL
jgi:DNA-directed RNA polymerase subunit L